MKENKYTKEPTNFIERLAFAAGSGEIGELEEFTGIKYNTLKNYFYNEKKIPDSKVLLEIFENTGLGITWLLTGVGTMYEDITNQKSKTSIQDTETTTSPTEGVRITISSQKPIIIEVAAANSMQQVTVPKGRTLRTIPALDQESDLSEIVLSDEIIKSNKTE